MTALDELSLRKATAPHRTFFLMRSKGEAMFLNSASELMCQERIVLDRE